MPYLSAPDTMSIFTSAQQEKTFGGRSKGWTPSPTWIASVNEIESGYQEAHPFHLPRDLRVPGLIKSSIRGLGDHSAVTLSYGSGPRRVTGVIDDVIKFAAKGEVEIFDRGRRLGFMIGGDVIHVTSLLYAHIRDDDSIASAVRRIEWEAQMGPAPNTYRVRGGDNITNISIHVGASSLPIDVVRMKPSEIREAGGILADVEVRNYLRRRLGPSLCPEQMLAMVNHEPSKMAMLLLRGCRSYVRRRCMKQAVVASRRGAAKGRGWDADESQMLESLSANRLMTVKQVSGFTAHIEYFTSAKGYALLCRFAQRKEFKPFFDAYTSHMTEDMAKAHDLMAKMAGGYIRPQWLLGKAED